MYKYVFDEQTTNQIVDSTNKTKNLLEQFSDVDKKYSTSNDINTSLNLEKISYVEPSNKQIETQAKNSLQEYKDNGINEITNKYNSKSDTIDSSINKVKKDTQNQKQEIEKSYSEAKVRAENDAIKRGLARSSIIVNKLAGFDNSMLNNLAQLSSESQAKVDELSNQKNALEEEKQSALNAFDIQYAVKLQDKIDSIVSDITKAKESAIKYNNEISQLQAKWERENEQKSYDRGMDMAEFLSKNGTYGLDIMKRNEKYQIAREYLKSLDKETAIQELKSNSAYIENLGETNYSKLLKELQQ